MFFGGHTVTLGKVNLVIGQDSIVVVIGFSSHCWKDLFIIIPAPINPAITIVTQNSLAYCLVDAMCPKPAMLELSRKF